MVHYTSYGTPGGEYQSTCRAAIITAVDVPHDMLSLAVMNPEGMFFNAEVQACGCGDDEGYGIHHGGTWHWPEKVGS